MKKKVLLAEYDVSTLEFIQKLFNRDDIDLTIVKDGEQAKKLLLTGTFDLIITAAMLPKVHGFNLSQFVSDKFPSTKVVIISGIYKGVDYKHQAITQYKADNFFEKPLNIPVFKKEIFRLLDLTSITTEMPAASSEKTSQPKPQTPPPSPPPKAPSTADTQKTPAMKSSKDTSGGLTSQDIFGDIIKDIESAPRKTAPVQEKQTPKPVKKENPGKTQVFDRSELDKMLKQRAPEHELKAARKNSKIEKDIADKFEETLSGLGLNKKNDTRSSTNRKISKAIEDKLENTLSGLGLEEKKIKKVIGDQASEELGNYDILGLIARGGMAEIYKAKKKGVKGFEKIIAIKKILSGYGEDDKYIEMFVDEAKIAAELSHPNIVQIYDFGKKDNFYFIAMEYVHGKDLRLILRKLAEKGRTMPEPLALYLVLKVLEALDYAHSAKTSTGKQLDIVHRDISPPNILISFTGDVKLTDFGVSKASTKMHQTVSGALKGKLLYMSPEQAKGETSIDSRSDLYSVGIILFELLTGKKLFLANSELAVLKKVQEGIVTGPSEFNPSISNQLNALVLAALKSDKDNRYSNASEMIKDLEKYYRDHYENFPNHQHIAAFLYNLFKEEIKEKKLVEKPKSPPPIQPRMIVSREVTPPAPPEPAKIEEPVITLPSEDVISEEPATPPVEAEIKAEDLKVTEKPEISIESPSVPVDETPSPKEEISVEIKPEPVSLETDTLHNEEEEDKKEDEKFEPLFEINLDEASSDGVKKNDIPEPHADKISDDDIVPSEEAEQIEPVKSEAVYSSFDPEDEAPSGNSSVKRFLYIAAPLIIVVSLAVWYFTGNSSGTTPPAEAIKKEKPVDVKKEDPPAESEQKTVANGDSPQQNQLNKDIIKTEPPATKPEVTNKKTANKKKKTTSTPKRSEKKKSSNNISSNKKSTKKDSGKRNTQKKKDTTKKPENKPAVKKSEPEIKKQNTTDTEKPVKQTDNKNAMNLAERTDVPPPTITEKVAEDKKPAQPVVEKVTEGMVAASVDSYPVPLNVKELKVSRSIRRKLPSDEVVIASYLIDHNGNVERIKLTRKSSSNKLNSLIYSTIVDWKFRPATKQNVRVKLWQTKTFTIKK